MNNRDRNLKLTIKNVRCFAREQNFDIRPLTFLVGENSTGKTTVMGCFSAIYDFISMGSWKILDFNKDPYFMGSFMDISRKSRKQNIQKNSFDLGIALGESNIKFKFHFVEKNKGMEPVINQVSIDFKDMTFVYEEKKRKTFYTVTQNNTELLKNINSVYYKSISDGQPLIWRAIEMYMRCISMPDSQKSSINKNKKIVSKAWEELRSYRREYFSEELFSLAPVRSKPQRTYNPVKESPSSEGREIPITLMRLSHQKSNIWKKIYKNLVDFGRASGLFSDIKIKEYGGSSGEPFQLQIQVMGVQSNIIDTGYGVSQILPLLVRLFASDTIEKKSPKRKGTRFLLQQPEVHLHPKAQAELASLLIQSTKSNNFFLVETHSDYIIDRTRIEIRKGNISSNKVSLIYLEPVKDGVKSHNILFDKQGNLIGAPTGYRDFFIKESNRFLGFKD